MQRIDLIGARPRTATGVLAAIVAVAVTTALIFPLRQIVPAVSTGVTYLLAVLVVSTVWGLRPGLLTAVLSALCFNWFHIPPTGRFTIAEGQNWVALGVFFAAAAIASYVAELARSRAADADRRRREASLSAEMARLLLAGETPDRALPEVSERLASALGIAWVDVVLGGGASRPDAVAVPLVREGERIATVLAAADIDRPRREQLEERVGPALATLLAAALEREQLAAAAVEAQALRRSDELKTALLRSVSHDLRTSADRDRRRRGRARLAGDHRPTQRDELAEVDLGSSRRGSSRLVDQLLDLSRLEIGCRRAAPRLVLDRGDRLGAAADQVAGAAFERRLRSGPPARRRRRRPARAGARRTSSTTRSATAGDSVVAVHARTVGPAWA